jgi:hypothetical protein
MCTVLLPAGANPIAVNKYHIKKSMRMCERCDVNVKKQFILLKYYAIAHSNSDPK